MGLALKMLHVIDLLYVPTIFDCKEEAAKVHFSAGLSKTELTHLVILHALLPVL